jgi:hypothetical protein
MPLLPDSDLFLDFAAAHLNLGATPALDSLQVSLFLDEPDCALDTNGLFSRFHGLLPLLSEFFDFVSFHLGILIDFSGHAILGQMQ